MDTLIVEDEKLAVANLKYILAEINPGIRVIGTVSSVEECVEWLSENKAPDLIFMDIQLSDGSSFEIFDRIEVPSPVIFTTAYDEYALKAFKVNALDYLIKPIDPEEVRHAIKKYSTMAGMVQTSIIAGKYPQKLLVSHRDRLIPINTSDVAYIYMSNKDSHICLTDGTRFRNRRSLDEMSRLLNPERFYRANKQFIIAKKQIKSIIVWPDSRLLVEIGQSVPERIFISKNRSADFRRWITG